VSIAFSASSLDFLFASPRTYDSTITIRAGGSFPGLVPSLSCKLLEDTFFSLISVVSEDVP
jgi:hypothetical protein